VNPKDAVKLDMEEYTRNFVNRYLEELKSEHARS
jgi:hypothetical protein